MSEFQNPEAQRQAEIEHIYNQIEKLSEELQALPVVEDEDEKIESGEITPQEQEIIAERDSYQTKIEDNYAKIYDLVRNDSKGLVDLFNRFVKGRVINYQVVAQELGFPVEEIADLVVGDLLPRAEIENRDELITKAQTVIENDYPEIMESEE